MRATHTSPRAVGVQFEEPLPRWRVHVAQRLAVRARVLRPVCATPLRSALRVTDAAGRLELRFGQVKAIATKDELAAQMATIRAGAGSKPEPVQVEAPCASGSCGETGIVKRGEDIRGGEKRFRPSASDTPVATASVSPWGAGTVPHHTSQQALQRARSACGTLALLAWPKMRTAPGRGREAGPVSCNLTPARASAGSGTRTATARRPNARWAGRKPAAGSTSRPTSPPSPGAERARRRFSHRRAARRRPRTVMAGGLRRPRGQGRRGQAVGRLDRHPPQGSHLPR